MIKLLNFIARLLRLPNYAIVLVSFLLVSCGDGSDLSGLFASSGSEAEDSGGLSDTYNLSASAELTQVSLSWNEDPDATSYDLFRYQDSNCAGIPDDYSACDNASYKSLSAPSAVDTGLSSNSIYYYRVRSVNSEQTGELSNQLEVLTLPSASSSLSAAVGNGRVTLSWADQPGIEQYQLYRYSNQDCDSVATDITACTDDESWTIPGGETSQQDSGLQGGRTYYYQMVSVNATGSSSLSPQLTFLSPPESVDGFGILSSSGAIGGISLVWNEAAGASYYEIYRDSGSGCAGIPDDLALCPDAVQFSVEESQYLDVSAQEGFSYYYSVRAVNSSGTSALTTQRYASMALELYPPVLSSAVAQDLAIDLNWSVADKALSYQVYISTDANCPNFPSNPEDCPGFVWLSPEISSNITEATSASFSNLAEGATYYLSVRSITGDTISDLSTELDATTAPAAPASSSFQALGGSGLVDLTWSASAGAETYSLYWHNDSSCIDSVTTAADLVANCSDYALITDIVGENYIHSDLNASTNYYYHLLANNAAGASALTSVASALTAPAAVDNPVSESNTSAITISWSSAQTNLERFELYRYQNAGCDPLSLACDDQNSWPELAADSSSVVDTSAAIGTTYYYRIAAVNATARTLSSEIASALRLSPVDQIAVAAAEGSLTVSWSAAAGAEHYVLYRYSGECLQLPDTDSTCSDYQEHVLDANISSYEDLAVIAGVTYSYQIAAAITGAEDSELSATASAIPLLSTPELAATPITGGVRIEFDLIAGADSYNIYRYYDSGCIDSAASAGVSCFDYELLELAADSSDLVNPDDSTTTRYDDLGLVGGATYYYRVGAVNSINTSELAPEVSSMAYLSQPTIVSGVAGYGAASIEWGAVLGAETYTIYQYLADGSDCYPQSASASTACTAGYGEAIITATADNDAADSNYSQAFAELDGALDYGYVVLTSNALVPDSVLSEPLVLSIGLPAPTSLAAQAGASSVSLDWSAVTNAAGYAVLRSSAANCLSLEGDNASCPDYARFAVGLDLSLVDTGLDGGTTYYYRVAALEDASTSGAYSTEASATPTLLTPQNLQASAGSGLAELVWDPVLGAESYTIYRYTQQPCAQILGTGDDCGELHLESNNSAHSHTSRSLIGDQTYYFRIAATHPSVADSNLSDEASATPEVGVPILEVSVIENNLSVSWDAIAGVSGYNLHRSTGASCFLDVAPADYASNSVLCPDYQLWEGITATSVAENDLSLGQSYYYAVQSVVVGNVIDILSNIVSGLPLAQPQWLDIVGGVDEISLSWDSTSSGAESYTIYRSSRAHCLEALADWQQCPQGRIFADNSSGVFVDQDSLDPGQTYYYRLQALNASGYALNPSELNATTAPGVPADINLSFSELGVTIEWDAAQLGVTQYDLYRYTVAECEFIPDAYQQCGSAASRWLGASSPFLDPVADLDPGNIYYYTLIVSNAAGSNASAEQQILTGSAAPDIGGIVGGYGSIEVSWGAVFGADSYNLYRYAAADCSDIDVVELSPDCSAYKFEDITSPFTDPPSTDIELQLDSSTYYYYRLTSINATGSSALSATGTGLTKPDAPEITLATGGDKSAYLEYLSANANLNNYIFSRDTVSGCNLDLGSEVCPFMVELDGDLDSNYTDSDLNPGTTYYYHAYAVNNSGRSPASNEVAITTIPNPPLNLAATAASTTEVVITWDRQDGAASYSLYRYTDASCTTEQLAADISQCGSELSPAQLIADIPDDTATPTYTDYGLNSDAYYYYRIRAQNAGGISAFSAEVASLTSPSQPDDLSGIGGNEEVNLSWSPVANASYYYLYKYTNAGCASYAEDISSCSDGSQRQISPGSLDEVLSSYRDTEVSNSTYYYYRIQAINASGASVISDELEVLTYPSSPQSITSSVSSSKISLTWSIETSVSNYELYRYSNSACSSLFDDYAACDDGVLYPITNTTSDIDLQSKTDDDSLQVGTIYYYRLVSHNASGSMATDEFAIATAPATPQNFSVLPILGLDPSLQLSWSADTTGVADFTIYRYQPAGCLLDDGDTSACAAGFPLTFNGITAQSFADTTGLSAGTQYSYRVAATGSHSGQAQSALSVEVSSSTYPAPPVITALEAGDDSMSISYDTDQAGAESYTLHRYSGLPGCLSLTGVETNCNDYQVYYNQTLSPIIDTDLDSGTLYYYRIAANGAAGTGVYSDEYSATTLPESPPEVSLEVSLAGITARWEPDHQGAESFILYRSRTPDCLVTSSDGSLCTAYLEVTALTSGEYIDTDLAYGYQYYYQLRAANASGTSALSEEVSAYTLPPAPSIASVVGGQNQVEISYSKNDLGGVTSYNLYRYADSGCEHIPGNSYSECLDGELWSSTGAIDQSTATITDDDLEDGTTYYYRLAAVNDSGEGPASEEYAAVTIPSAPTITALTGGNRKMEIEFTDDLSSASSYLVYRYSIPGCYDSSADACAGNEWDAFSVSSSPTTDSGLDEGTEFYYSIVAVNSSGASLFSNEESAYTIPKESSIDQVIGGDGNLEVHFDDSIAGADTYHIYGYTGSSCIQRLSDYASKQEECAAVLIESSTSAAFEGDLGDGVTRYYRVASVNDSGSSDLSGQASGITLPPAATDIAFTGDDTSITLSWDDDQNGVSSYTAYQYANSNCGNFAASEDSDIFNACAPSLQSHDSASSPVTFTGLASGTTYYHMLKSSNAAGYRFTEELSSATVPSAPPAPTLTGGADSVLINFDTASVIGADHFQIYRSTTSACVRNTSQATCTNLVTLPADPSQPLTASDFPYQDGDLLAGTTYYYHLSAHNDLGASPYSEESAISTIPDAPSAISLAPARNGMVVSWSNNLGVENTRLYRYGNAGCASVPDAIGSCDQPGYAELEATASSYTDSDLADGTTYYYILEASNSSGSSFSAELSALTNPAASAITALSTTSSGLDRNVSVTFTTDLDGAVDSYQLHRHSSSEPECIVENGDYSLNTSACTGFTTLPSILEPVLVASPYTDASGLSPGVTYHYQVQSFNSSGSSALSEVTSITTVPPAPLATNIAITSGLDESDANVVTITWNNNIPGNDSSTLYRYTIAGCQTIYGTNADASQCGSDDDDYKVWDNLSEPSAALSIEDTGLQSSTEYYYVIQVSNSSGSDYSEELAIATYPAVPEEPTLTGGERSIVVEWDNTIPTITSYTLYFNSDSSCAYADTSCAGYFSKAFTSDVSSFTFQNLADATALSDSTIYYVTLVVDNAAGSRASNTVSAITLPAAPVITALDYLSSTSSSSFATSDSIDLSWSHSGQGIESYSLVRYEDPDCMSEDGDYSACATDQLYVEDDIDATATSFTDSTDLEAATRYYYRLGANNASGSAWSAVGEQVTAPETIEPVITSGSDSITVSWTIPEGQEISYVKAYSTSKRGCSSMPNTGCSDWWDSGELSPTDGSTTHYPTDTTKTYYLYLHAFNASGDALSAAFDGVLKAEAPEFTSIAGGDQSIDIAWQNYSNATYTLYFYDTSCLAPDTSPSACGNLEVHSLNQNSASVSTINSTQLAVGTEYFFRVSVTNASGTSALSDENSSYTIAGVPQNIALTAGGNQISISWDPAQGATNAYNIYRYQNSCSVASSADLIDQCTSASFLVNSTTPYVDANLPAGETYYYRLSSVNAAGESALSAEASAEVLLGAPVGLSAASSSSGIELSWTTINGAESHEIYRYTSADCMTVRADMASCTYDTIPLNNATTYTDSSIVGGTTYYYRVAAGKSGLPAGELSNEASASAELLSPQINSISAGYGEIDLQWSSVEGAASYKIYRSASSGCLTDSSTTCAEDTISVTAPTTTYSDTGLQGLQTYYYRIAAVASAAGVDDSLLSNEVSATTGLPAPVNLVVTPGELSLALSWDAVTSTAVDDSDISYVVYRYTNVNNNCTQPHVSGPDLQCSNLVSNDTTATSYTDSSFTEGGADYKYRVQSLHTSGGSTDEGDISAEVVAQPILATPTGLALERGSTSLTLSWDAVDGADEYIAHHHNDSTCATSTANLITCTGYATTTTSATTFAATNLDPSQTYYFTVQATKSDADSPSAYGMVQSAVPYLADIANFSAYASGALQLKAEWAPVDGADSYTVYFHQDSDCEYSGFTEAGSTCPSSGISYPTSATSMEFTNNIAEGETYYFQVRANTTSGNISAYSTRRQVTAFSNPGVTTIVGDDQEINLSVYDSGGNYQLEVYRYTDVNCTDSELSQNVYSCILSGDSADDAYEWSYSQSQLNGSLIAINDTNKLQAGKRYYYKVWSTPSLSDPGVYSDHSSAMTMPPAPTTLGLDSAASYGTQISLTFARPDGEDNHYQLLRHTDADCFASLSDDDFSRLDYRELSAIESCAGFTRLADPPATFPATSKATESYLDSGLDTSTTYYYLYRSVNYSGSQGVDNTTLSGTSPISNILEWGTIPRVSEAGDLIIDADYVTKSSIQYSFTEIPAATSYTVHRYPASCTEFDITACTYYQDFAHDESAVGTTHTDDTGLTSGTQYSYILQAHNAAGSTDLASSHVLSVATLSDDPVITVTGGLDNDANQFIISWNDDASVTNRDIYGTTSEACLNTVVTTAATNIATCADHIYIPSSTIANDRKISSHTADSSSLHSGTTYYFTITNNNATGPSNFATIESNTTVPAATNDISLAAAYRQIAVTWVPPLGSDSNVLYRYNNSRCDKPVTELSTCGSDTAAYTFTTTDLGFTPDSSTSFTYLDTNNDSGLLDAEEYRYVVQALNVSGYRLTEDNFIDANYTAPAIPTNLSAIATDNNIALSWDDMDQADQYHILRSTDDQCYTDSTGLSDYDPAACLNSEAITFDIAHSDTSTTQTFTDTALTYGTVYYYWIRSSSTSGSSPSTATPETNTTAPPRAAQVTLTATRGSTNQTNIEINWSAADEATSYALYRSTADACISDGDGNLSTTASSCAGYNRSEIFALTSTNSNLPNDTIYYYYVAGINAAGEGRLSSVNSVRTAATAPSLNYDNSLIAVDRIKYSWSAASAYDSEYQIYLYTGSSSCDPSTSACANEISVTTDQSPYTVTGLTAGTEYHAKIVATTEYTQEDLNTSTLTGDISSSAKSEHTLPYHPQIASHTIDNNNNVTLTLTPNGGTDSITYTIRRTSDDSCDRDSIGSSCSGYHTQTSTSNTITDSDSKDTSTNYYYYVWSKNSGGSGVEPSNYDDSPHIVMTGPTTVSGTTLSYSYDDSTYNKIAISLTSPENIPENDAWQLVYYPSKLDSYTPQTYTISSFDSSADYQTDLTLNSDYYLQPHTVDLVATNASGNTITLSSGEVSQLPYPQIYSKSTATDDRESAVKSIDYYIKLSSAFHSGSEAAAIRNAYGLNISLRYYVTKNNNNSIADGCLLENLLIAETTANCSKSSGLYSIRDMDRDDKKYYEGLVSTNVSFDDTTDLFTYTHYFSDLKPTESGATYAYFYYSVIDSYTINTNGSGTPTTITYPEGERVAGSYVLLSISDTASNTNSVSAPESLLVANPPLLAQQLSATSTDANSWDLSLLWSALSGISAYDIYEYSNPDCAYLLSEPSLCANFNLYSSNIPEFTRAFSGTDSGNYFYYRLQAHDSVGNSSALGEQIAVYPPQPLNDSGLSTCLESELISGSQDCQVGRDAELEASAKVGSGSAGFDFNSSTDESGQLCVQDNVTGLSWLAWSPGSDAALVGLDTNTASFAELATITADACGHSDWRLPSLHELLSIADYNQSAAKLDTSIFAEFNASQPTYWSASGHVLDFSSGELGFESSASARHSVFLTRGARSWGSEFGAERFQLIEELDDNNLSIYLVLDKHSQLRYAPCLAGMSYDSFTHSCSGAATALDYIDSLNAYDANSSWRQPNIKELVSILDPSNALQPSPAFFPAYPAGAQIFSLTPSAQSVDSITGRLLDVETQSTQPALFELLNSHLIYRH